VTAKSPAPPGVSCTVPLVTRLRVSLKQDIAGNVRDQKSEQGF
jgi:hypothetical protein